MSDQKWLLQHAASQALREGRVNDAIFGYQQLLVIDEHIPDAWYNLGYLQRCDRRFEDAIASYRKALENGISRPEDVHVNIAVILTEHLNRPDEGAKELAKALKLNAKCLPALLNLGNLREDLGDWQAAKSIYEDALLVAPENTRALSRIAAIDTYHGQPAAAIDRISKALAAASTMDSDVSELNYALGHALDSIGEYDLAFSAFLAANAPLALASRYDPQAQEQLIDALIQAFPLPNILKVEEHLDVPLFICGMFRSGSTLAEQILARHSRVTAGGEFEFIPALVASRLQPYPASLLTIDEDQIANLRNTYLQDLRRAHPRDDLVTDKRPDNFLHIGLIKTLFPSAKIVHTVRNPLDNVVSIFFGEFDQSVDYGSSMENIVHWYKQYERLMRHWKSVYGQDIYDLDYDITVADPAAELPKLLAFCGLDWEDTFLSPTPAEGIIRTLSTWQVRQPLHQKSSGRWTNYRTQLQSVIKALGTT